MKSNVIGIFLALTVTYLGVQNSIIDQNIVFNLIGFVVVLGGTLAAGLITFGLKDIISICSIVFTAFSRKKDRTTEVISDFLKISVELEKSPTAISLMKDRPLHPFMKDGLRLIENDFSRERIDEIMSMDLESRVERQTYHIEILKTLAKYPPAFGMVGTVIGLVGLLNSLKADQGGEALIGPSMAVALLTTLYGLLIANYFFIPLSDNLLCRLNKDVALRKLIIKGVLLVKDKEDPIHMKEILTIHLPPKKRKDKILIMKNA